MVIAGPRAAAVCGLALCLAGLGLASGYPSGTLLVTEGGNNINNATLLVAYTPEGGTLDSVNLSAAVSGLYTAAPPAISPDGKYAFSVVSVTVNATDVATPILVTDLSSGKVVATLNGIHAPANCSFQTGLEGSFSTIAVGHGHAPGTYFLWGLLVCSDGRFDLLPDGEDSCSNLYLVRYIYTESTHELALAEQYTVSTNFDCKTSYLTKYVRQLADVNGTLYGFGDRSQNRVDKEEAVFAFDTHARVFRTEVTIPTGDCTVVAAIEGANSFYSACLSNPVKHVTSGAPSAVVFTPQAGTLVAAIATAPSSPYLFVLATNATTLFGPPVDVHAVLKATNEVVHSFVINKAAGGPAVVP